MQNVQSQRRAAPYDLLLKGGRVLDPGQSIDRTADVAIADGKIAAIEPAIARELAQRTIDVDGLLVTPGLIDLHVHCNTHHDPEALEPDIAGVMQGITRIVSPGDVGAYTFQAFRKHVVERASTRVQCWLSAAAHGGVVYGLNNATLALHPKLMDVEAAIQTIEAFPDIVRGIKMYWAPDGWGTWDGTDVFRRSMFIAETAKVPLFIHTGSFSSAGGNYGWQTWIDFQEPEAGGRPSFFGRSMTMDEVMSALLERLRPGDIITHMFTTLGGGIWSPEKRALLPGVKEAQARGVLFDVGHGSHFNLSVVRGVLDAGILPFTISSDRHADDKLHGHDRSSGSGLCTVMSKFMALGLSLADVVRMTTYNAAVALRITDRAGSLAVGMPAEISVLIQREGKWTFYDRGSAHGDPPQELPGRYRLTPVLSVLGDRVFPVNPAFLPDGELLNVDPVWRWWSQSSAGEKAQLERTICPPIARKT